MTDAWTRDAEIRATEEERYTMAKWNLDQKQQKEMGFDPVNKPAHLTKDTKHVHNINS